MALFPLQGTGPGVYRAARQARPWVEWLARFGYAAKGIVYLIVGGLALKAALGQGGRTTGTRGAMRALLDQPMGRVLLAVVAVGLAGYTLWRLVQAALDPEHREGGAKRAAVRLGYAISGCIHAGLTLAAVRLVTSSGGGGGGDDQGARHWSAVALSHPYGPWLLGAVGAGIIVDGLIELYRAYRADLPERLELHRMRHGARRWAVRAARLGMAARGVVFGIIGIFLVRAALYYDPGEARGMGGALRSLREQPYGPWLLGGVALGLMGYGILQLVEARYRRIRAA